MQIRKYQNSEKLDEGEVHVNIEPITIIPEPWQYIMRDEFLKDMDIKDRKTAINVFNTMFQTAHLNDKETKSLPNIIYDRWGRLYNLWNWAGKPKVKSHDGRAYYHPFTNTIYSDPTHILSELAHPLQMKYGSKSANINSIAKTLWGEGLRIGRNIFNNPHPNKNSNSNSNRLWYNYDHYDDPSHYEYETHKIFEPQMNNYIYLPFPYKDRYYYKPPFMYGDLKLNPPIFVSNAIKPFVDNTINSNVDDMKKILEKW